MSLMSKLLMSTVAVTVALSANAQPDNKQLLKYVKITPERTTHFTKQGDDNVIDVEIIDEHSHSDRSS